jgi:hypothetical protein
MEESVEFHYPTALYLIESRRLTGWVGPRDGLHLMLRRKIPALVSNVTPVVQPVVLSMWNKQQNIVTYSGVELRLASCSPVLLLVVGGGGGEEG